jgi:hypothetical protein
MASTPDMTPSTSLAELYFKMADAESASAGGKCAAILQQLVQYKDTQIEDCAQGACPADVLSADLLECEGAQDLAAALVGMRPGKAWVTRLEANIPKTQLNLDLTLEPAAKQEDMSSWIVAKQHQNCTEEFYATASLDVPRPGPKSLEWMAAAFAFGAALIRRRGGKAGDARPTE